MDETKETTSIGIYVQDYIGNKEGFIKLIDDVISKTSGLIKIYTLKYHNEILDSAIEVLKRERDEIVTVEEIFKHNYKTFGSNTKNVSILELLIKSNIILLDSQVLDESYNNQRQFNNYIKKLSNIMNITINEFYSNNQYTILFKNTFLNKKEKR